jgi:hypothetical protein
MITRHTSRAHKQDLYAPTLTTTCEGATGASVAAAEGAATPTVVLGAAPCVGLLTAKDDTEEAVVSGGGLRANGVNTTSLVGRGAASALLATTSVGGRTPLSRPPAPVPVPVPALPLELGPASGFEAAELEAEEEEAGTKPKGTRPTITHVGI